VNITNLNPDTDIGASAWLVAVDDHHILLDAGMHPKREGREALPMLGKAGKVEVDAIAISHCHHDHVGGLPVAVRHFPKAHVLMSELSCFIVERVLHNSVNVMTRQRDELGLREYPLCTHDEVDDIAPLFQGFKYNREVEWAAFHKTRPFRHRQQSSPDQLSPKGKTRSELNIPQIPASPCHRKETGAALGFPGPVCHSLFSG
jgi:Cft2 family RNA processing exonuclease